MNENIKKAIEEIIAEKGEKFTEIAVIKIADYVKKNPTKIEFIIKML